MYTYDPNANKKNVDSENMNSLNEEDLFLAGGFDSFSPNQTANNSMHQPVGQMELDPSWNVERWKNKYELKFFEQLKLSFFPLKYDRYREMSVDGIKLFIRKDVAFELLVSFIIILIAFNVHPFFRALMPEYGINDPMVILTIAVVLGISAAITILIFPFFIRIGAWIFRWIIRLFCLLGKKNLSDTSLYALSIYSTIPFRLIKMFCIFLPIDVILNAQTSIAVLDVVVPLIIISLAIPRMD